MKAKELRPFAERLITAGKSGDVHARRRVARHIHDGIVARKLVETLSTRFAERPGGYTRIIKLGPRRGDAAEMAIVELIGSEPTFEPREEDKKDRGRLGKIRERFSRRKAAPAEAAEGAEEAAEESPVKKAKPKPAKAAKAPAAKAAKSKPSSKPSGKGGAKAAGGKRGGQTPKKGG
jgi:large subunit ribosomal protein L17